MISKVIHIKDAPEGWQQDSNFVYIGRGNAHKGLPQSKWANPYRIEDAPAVFRLESERRAWAINAYAAYLSMSEDLQCDLPELAGKVLVCWCKNTKGKGVDVRCHGDILARWWNHLDTFRYKFRALNPSYVPRTIMIAGSRRPVSPRMVATARRLILECFYRNDNLIVGDALGVDAIAADWAERLLVPYTLYGVTEEGRGIQSSNYIQLSKEDLQGLGEGNGFTLRDRYIIKQADEVFVVWNGRNDSKGSLAVVEYAVQINKRVQLIEPDKQYTKQRNLSFAD